MQRLKTMIRRYGPPLLILAALFGAITWWMNRDTSWNATEALVAEGSVKEPRVGVVIVALTQPSQYKQFFWTNISKKIFDTVIPWPINRLASRDRGVALADPAKPGETAPFAPTRLLDMNGLDKDRDGVNWMDKYRKGEIEWVAPSKSIAHDIGYFLYDGRKQGLPTSTAKTSVKARYLYHGQLKDGYLPHGEQTEALGRGTAALLMERHKQVVAAEFASAFDYVQKEAAVRRVLDSGIDVLVLGSGQPIYSDFEELRGSFSTIYKIVAAWKVENPGKKVRIAVAPWMGSAASYDQLWLDHFAATVPSATGPGQKAMGIFSLHGLPTSLANKSKTTELFGHVVHRNTPTDRRQMKLITGGFEDGF